MKHIFNVLFIIVYIIAAIISINMVVHLYGDTWVSLCIGAVIALVLFKLMQKVYKVLIH